MEVTTKQAWRRSHRKELAAYQHAYRLAHKEEYSTYRRSWERAHRLKIQDRVNQIKLEHGCHKCGFRGHPKALDFHHVGGKTLEISKAVNRMWRWDRIAEELMRCEILCANCHRAGHGSISSDEGGMD